MNPPSRDRPLAFLGVCHLLGGALGIGGLTLANPTARNWPDYWIVTGTVLSSLSLASGLAILGRRRAAIGLATLVESLQLVAFHTGAFGFQFYSGVQAILLLSPTGVRVSANVQSSFGIGPAMLVREPFIAFDILSLIFLWLLWKGARATSDARLTQQPGPGIATGRAV